MREKAPHRKSINGTTSFGEVVEPSPDLLQAHPERPSITTIVRLQISVALEWIKNWFIALACAQSTVLTSCRGTSDSNEDRSFGEKVDRRRTTPV